MYHERTYAQIRRRRLRLLATALVGALLALGCFWGSQTLQESAREQGAASLRDSIVEAAKQCCAVEGSYPSSLSHLEDRYGLSINHADYVITYEWFADNVAPSVVVVPR